MCIRDREETRPVAEPTPSRMDSMPVITDVEQLSLFGGEKPSLLGQLAATKAVSYTHLDVYKRQGLIG